MFAGIIEEVGAIDAVEPLEGGARLRIACHTIGDGLHEGDSIAIDGVCQTVVARNGGRFSVEAIRTTLARTTLGNLRAGDEVNLERALALGERIGGHLVQGHVDGVGTVVSIEPHREHVLADIRMPDTVAEVTVLHGSIAINGVSLTVNALLAADIVQVALIPYTWNHTTLRRLTPGARVNLEGDMMGKFVMHYLKRRGVPGV
jgi:riboflavin synthase